MPITRGLALAFATLLALLLPAAARAADLTLDSSSGYTIPVQINGHALRLRVDLSASGYVLLNPDAAARAGLGGSMVRSRTLVGPHVLRGSSNAVRLTIAGTELRERVAWFDRPAVEGADGVISPEVLPYDNIILQLAPEQPGQRDYEIALSFTKSAGLFLPYSVQGHTTGVDFSLFRPRSIATAAAGAVIATENGGTWSGETSEEMISFGIARPVRPMHLERPLLLGGIALPDLVVRTADHRGNFALPSDQEADSGEVVVTGQTRSRQRASLSLTIGLDRLGSCTSATYRKAGRLLRLRCPA